MIPHILEAVALILGGVTLIQSKGQSLLAWAIVALAVALLYGLL